MKETFDFKRFGTYFLYDLKQMGRNHSKAAVLIGCSGLILYIIWVLCSLVFAQRWVAPPIEARVTMFILAFCALELYQTRTYGYLTEKRAGSSWLMIPASTPEKFVSMLVMTLIVIPVIYIGVYFILDGILALLDPTFGKSLFTGTGVAYNGLLGSLTEINGERVNLLSPGALITMSVLGLCFNFLYFLLCGICFKKHKIIGAIGISMGVGLVLSLILGAFTPQWVESMSGMDEEASLRLFHSILNASYVWSALLTVGIGAGIFYRLKTLKH
ncbi:MAG: hypothetical protein IJ721_10025 [Bacteroidales bacterium]|nr:hypothetical protein [Bacteroidales bacterium]